MGSMFKDLPPISPELKEALEMAKSEPEIDLTGRALDLAGLVSRKLLGGSRGWEKLTKEEFRAFYEQVSLALRHEK